MSESEAVSSHEAHGHKKVLVVSQDHDAREACREAEEIDRTLAGAELIFADSVDAAKNLIRCESPDMVLVDTRLLGGSPQGIELEGWLSEQAATKGLHVVWCRQGD